MLKTLQLLLPCGVVLLFAVMPATAQTNDGWHLKSDKDAVKVYYRKTSDIHEIKLVTSMKTSLSGIIQMFSEIENYPVWGYKVVESHLVRRISNMEQYYYTRLDFPWPLSDRDIVMHTVLSQDPATRTVTATSYAAPDEKPEVKDVVRIRNAHTKWTLVPGPGGWLYIEYYIYSNPGGNLPDWLINMAIDAGPRETVKNIRKLLQQPRYQTVKLAHIRD